MRLAYVLALEGQIWVLSERIIMKHVQAQRPVVNDFYRSEGQMAVLRVSGITLDEKVPCGAVCFGALRHPAIGSFSIHRISCAFFTNSIGA